VVLNREGPARPTNPPEERSRRSGAGIPKPSRQLPRGFVKACFLLLVCGLTWMIWQSNQNTKPTRPRAAAPTADVSGSVGRFVSGLFLSKTGARADARPEDQLELQGIILSRRRPIAMINTLAFEQGARAPLRLAARDYSVHCLDILQDQVTVRADEREPVTLELKERRVQ